MRLSSREYYRILRPHHNRLTCLILACPDWIWYGTALGLGTVVGIILIGKLL